MIVADGLRKDKRVLETWVQSESERIAPEMLQGMPPAVRQTMTTLDAIETSTQVVTQRIGRRLTEALMDAAVPEPVGVCRVCRAPESSPVLFIK